MVIINLILSVTLVISSTCLLKAESLIDIATTYSQACKYARNNQIDEAIKLLKAIIRQEPNELHSCYKLALLLHQKNNNEHALILLKHITKYITDQPTVWYNIGYLSSLEGELYEAVKAYETTLIFEPSYESAHFGLAKACLALGDFKRGWEEFEWRYGTVDIFKQSPINLSTLKGKRVLVRAEWGFGDMLQFIRYTKLLKESDAYVIVESFKSLLPLLKSCPFIDELYHIGQKLPSVDFSFPILSLPLIFGTRLDTIPSPIPYLFADQTLINYWKDNIPFPEDIRIGICWHAKPIYLEERIKTRRSIPLSLFQPLSMLPSVRLFSLQKIHGLEELKNCSFSIHNFDDFDTKNGSFMDTAAIMHHLDLIITADTAVVHVAGALGIPTWVLLPYNAEWRWMRDTSDTPWYPTMRLFRQHTPGNWHDVIFEVEQALNEFIAQKKKK